MRWADAAFVNFVVVFAVTSAADQFTQAWSINQFHRFIDFCRRRRGWLMQHETIVTDDKTC